ncbi:MAG: PEGA domain-containing protein [Deinococcales bacterium]
MKLKALLSAAFALFSGMAFAQSAPVVSPQGIVVNPTPTELKVQVAINKTGVNPLYTEGENLQVSVSVNQDAYVYVFNIAADNSVSVLLPNGFPGGRQPQLRAGETRTFPAANDGYRLTISAPFGQEKIFALASKTPLNLSAVIPQVQANSIPTATVQGASGLARPLAVVVTPLPPQDWTSAYVDFRTQARPVVQSTGVLQINSNVRGAQVFINNVLAGNTPLSFNAPAGQHSVRVTANGFRDQTQTVTVRGGQTISLNFNLQPIVQNGTIQVVSNVANAQVFVDNVLSGNTPANITVPAGQHTVRVAAPGFQDFNTTVNVSAGGVVNVRAVLQAIIQNGTLQVVAPNNAQVFINNNLQGTGSGQITVPAGQYTVRVTAPGFQDFVTTVSVQPGQTTTVRADLQPLSGSLIVRSNVASAKVFINGNEVGIVGNDGVIRIDNLPAGNHELTVVAAGFRTQVLQFSIRAGAITEIFANMVRL